MRDIYYTKMMLHYYSIILLKQFTKSKRNLNIFFNIVILFLGSVTISSIIGNTPLLLIISSIVTLIITTVKSTIKIEEQIVRLNFLASEMDRIFIDIESFWFENSNDDKQENKWITKLNEIDKNVHYIHVLYDQTTYLKSKQKHLITAKKEMYKYANNMYGTK